MRNSRDYQTWNQETESYVVVISFNIFSYNLNEVLCNFYI